jgi:ABC-2 type transport system permease protein
MKQIIHILVNDLRRRLRSPVAVVLMMLIPIVITLLIGLVFGRTGEVTLPRIKVLLVDEDRGLFSNFFKQGMRQDRFAEMIELTEVTWEEGCELMESGKASALIVIPGESTARLLDNDAVELMIVKNPAEGFLPMIVEEMVHTMAVVFTGGVRILSEPIELARAMLEGGGWPSGSEIEELLGKARSGITLAEAYVTDSLITLRSEVAADGDSRDEGLNIFAFVLPGSLLIGLLFISEIVLRDIVRERREGTLGRLLSAPLETGHIIAGKILSTYAITGIACILLFAIGRLAFGIDLGEPLPLAVHFIGTILMCTGLMAFFYGLIRTERAADAILSVVIIVMALLGGSMIPIEQMGRSLQRIGRFSPVFWASDGFKQLFVYDAGFREIWLHLVVLYCIGVLAVIPGAIMLGRRVKGGGW